MTSIRFHVPAVPIAQPRQRHRVMQIAGRTLATNYTPSKHPVNDFKATVRQAARAAYLGAPLTGPLMLRLLFIMPRPGSMRWKTKDMPRVLHTSKPDLDNVIKAIKDALSKIVWIDDSQVAKLHAEKWVAAGHEQPGVSVGIDELTSTDAPDRQAFSCGVSSK